MKALEKQQEVLLKLQEALLKQHEENNKEADSERRRGEVLQNAFRFFMAEDLEEGALEEAPESTPIQDQARQARLLSPRPPVFTQPGKKLFTLPEDSNVVDFEQAMTITTAFVHSVDEVQKFQLTDIPVKNVQGFAQVLDCAATLQDGHVVPIMFLQKRKPSLMKEVSSTLVAKVAPATLNPCTEGLETLVVNEPIVDIMSHGPFLLAKGMDKGFLWKYLPHEGAFVGPTSFPLKTGAATTIIGGAVVGFDVDLISPNHYGYLRYFPFILTRIQIN